MAEQIIAVKETKYSIKKLIIIFLICVVLGYWMGETDEPIRNKKKKSSRSGSKKKGKTKKSIK